MANSPSLHDHYDGVAGTRGDFATLARVKVIVLHAERSLCIRHVRPSCTQDGHFGEVTLLRAKRSLGCEESDRSARRTITFRKVIVLHIERSLWFEESDRFATRTITLYKVIVLNSERSLFVHIRGFAGWGAGARALLATGCAPAPSA